MATAKISSCNLRGRCLYLVKQQKCRSFPGGCQLELRSRPAIRADTLRCNEWPASAFGPATCFIYRGPATAVSSRQSFIFIHQSSVLYSACATCTTGAARPALSAAGGTAGANGTALAAISAVSAIYAAAAFSAPTTATQKVAQRALDYLEYHWRHHPARLHWLQRPGRHQLRCLQTNHRAILCDGRILCLHPAATIRHGLWLSGQQCLPHH